MSNSAEAIVVAALDAAGIDNYPDVAPDGAAVPYIAFQAVGGQDVNDLDGAADLENARMQIAAWAGTRKEALACMRAARHALVSAGAWPIGAAVSVHEPDTRRHGSRMDFSIWFKP